MDTVKPGLISTLECKGKAHKGRRFSHFIPHPQGIYMFPFQFEGRGRAKIHVNPNKHCDECYDHCPRRMNWYGHNFHQLGLKFEKMLCVWGMLSKSCIWHSSLTLVTLTCNMLKIGKYLIVFTWKSGHNMQFYKKTCKKTLAVITQFEYTVLHFEKE